MSCYEFVCGSCSDKTLFISLAGRLDLLNFRAMGMKTNKPDLVPVAVSSHFLHPTSPTPPPPPFTMSVLQLCMQRDGH